MSGNNQANANSGNSMGMKCWFVRDSKNMDCNFKNNMLVVATLIVAVTFQTGISPPGGVWQDNMNGTNGHDAGKAVLAAHHIPYHLFLFLNTLAFSMSTQLILVLLYHDTLYLEAVVATLAMVATYVTAVWTLSPQKDVALHCVSVAALFPYLWCLFCQTLKKISSP